MPTIPVRPTLALGCFFGGASVLLAVLVAGRYPQAALWVVAIDAFLVAGIWAARRRPTSRAAHWLLVSGLVSTAWYSLGLVELLWYAESGPRSALLVLNLVVIALDVALPAAVMVLLATYPSGVASGRLARVVVAAGCSLVAVVPLLALAAGSQQVPAYVLVWNEDVTSMPGLFSGPDLTVLFHVGTALHEMALAILPLAGAAVLVAGYRRLAAADRVRVRWLGLAGLVVAADGVFTGIPGLDVVPVFVSIPLIGTFPLLAATGLVRPDLLDIDEAIRRSGLFAALWAGSSVAYLGLANAFGIATADRGVGTAVPAAVAATFAFHPVWQALVRRLTRHVYGVRLDGDELLHRVGQALEHTLEPGELAAALAETIREGLGVSWVRVALDGQPVALAGLDVPDDESPAIRTALEHEGTTLGRIECGPSRSGRGLRAPDLQRLRVLGRQLGLAAHHAHLAVEQAANIAQIRLQAAELAASRARIVAAEERGRRRIQRDIHDGVQQELVAIIGRVGLMEAQARRDASTVVPQLVELRGDASRALEDLRELAHGIHPSVLVDRGLVEALESRAASLPIGVVIDDGDRVRGTRLPPVVESALYFTASEALANAIKHSGASEVRVSLCASEDRVTLLVRDDGRGFEPHPTTGTGLEGLADRLQALGGSLSVDSRPGHGTVLRADLPLEQEAARD